MTDCPKRQELLQITAAGERRVIQRCGEPRADGTFGKNVTSEICGACPIRELLAGEAKRTKARKPAFDETHQVRSKKPDKSPPARWTECRFRKVCLTTACCGNPQLVRVCDCPQSTFHKQRIDAINCKSCTVREPFDET